MYVRKIDTIDIEDVHVLPRLPEVGGPAKVEVRAYLRNMTGKEREVTLRLLGGRRAHRAEGQGDPGATPGGSSPRRSRSSGRTLWQPGRPTLYPMTAAVEEDDEVRAIYRLRFGVRKLETAPGGVILLNGRRLNARGASIHEDDRNEGGALSQDTRRRLVARLRDLGATITRSHYPLHPAFLEAFDKYGILYWVDAPVYQVPNTFFDQAAVRAAAKRAVGLTVRNNINHPSIMTWSLANEPAGSRSELGNFGAGLQRYIQDGAAVVRELDDTRLVGDRPPVALRRAGRPAAPTARSTCSA